MLFYLCLSRHYNTTHKKPLRAKSHRYPLAKSVATKNGPKGQAVPAAKPPLAHTDNLLAVIAFGLIACILYGFGAGLRGDIGILLPALADHTGLAYQDVSFCIAVMNLVFGVTQPAFGVLAARTSNRLVLLMGAGLVAASLAGMAFSHSFMALPPTAGIVTAASPSPTQRPLSAFCSSAIR